LWEGIISERIGADLKLFWKNLLPSRSQWSPSRIWREFPFRITIAISVLLFVIGELGVFKILNENFAKPIEFRVRSGLGRDPVLDPRIKIFGFDDITLNALGRQALSYQEWGVLLGHLAKQKPRVIIIDQVFQVVDNGPELEQLVSSAPKDVPVVAGAFASGHPIVGRVAIDQNPILVRTDYDLPWQDSKTLQLYGPALGIRPLFYGFGAINYASQGKMPAALESPGGGMFPSLGLAAADSLSIEREGLYAGVKPVPVTKDGLIQANQSALRSYYRQIKTVKSVLDAARENKPVKDLDPGDVVFILPMMYSGNADFKSTPLGEFPGGLLHVAIANSALTDDWIHYFGNDLIFSIIAGLFAILLAKSLTPFKSSMFIFGMVFLILSVGIGAFVVAEIVTPWAEAAVFALVIGFAAIAERARALERRSMQIRHTLAGLVSPKLLQFLLTSPSRVLESSRRSDVTVMFIDIEGFSQRMQDRDPNLVFSMLKYELSHLCEIVQRHGGVVDKTLGDGLLCYFGYSFDPTAHTFKREHAFAAMSCALDIQIDSSRRALGEAVPVDNSARLGHALVFPLRIGITTGEVLIGNVGNRERIDMTIIGAVVNRAKRYEDSCESFRIMIDPRTRELLSKDPAPGNCVMKIGDRTHTLWAREIIVKHQDQLWSGWECNPFEHSSRRLSRSLAAVADKDLQSKQMPLDQQQLTLLVRGASVCKVISLSKEELIISSLDYLPKRALVDVRFIDATVEFDAALEDSDYYGNIDDFLQLAATEGHASVTQSAVSQQTLLTALPHLRLRATVLWGIQESGQSRHGLKIVGITPEVRAALFAALCRVSGVVQVDSKPVDAAEGFPQAV
jgi:class 3 adenylate cyclase